MSQQEGLAGGGEMGTLIRGKDWTATPFGPVTSWPQSLRTAVSIMLESRFAMVVAWGPEFRFLYNDRYRPVLGTSKHPGALGTPAREIFPEAWSFLEPLFESTRRGEAVALDDVLIPLHRHGYLENCWFTISYSPIRDESGGVGGMLAVVAETTERVEAERRMATLRDLAARSSEARTVGEASRHAASTFARNPVDVPFALVYLIEPGEAGARLVCSAGIAEGHPAAPATIELGRFADDRTWPLDAVMVAKKSMVVDDAGARFGTLPGGPFGEPAHTAVLLPLSRPGVDRLYGFLVAGVSPRRALDDRYRTFYELAAEHVTASLAGAHAYEEERRRAEALAELDRAKTTFFNNVSHEFRTPLTLVLGHADDLLHAGLPDDAHERVEVLQRNALRLLKLVNSLLDFARLEAGRMHASFEPVDLAAITAELASVFRSATEHAGLRLVVDCPPLGEPVWVDVEMWEKIVLNLLSNAFKFTFEGEIRLSLRAAGEGVALEVSDTGIGIAEADLPRIFERFHRVDGARARSHEGSGIGLALVQELVRMHGGTMRVHSVPGRGSSFVAIVPRGKTHLPIDRVGGGAGGGGGRPASTRLGARPFVEEAMRWLPDDDGGPVTTAPPGAPRVLVADDNADMRDYVARILRRRFEVAAVPDGAAALHLARRAPPDLVLADVMMPGLDGLALLRALRADPRTAHVPVIMLSARAGEDSRVEGLELGADDYLIKPFSARELVARVQTHVELARARQAGQKSLERLASAALSISSTLTLEDIVQRVTDEARHIIGADRAEITLLDGEEGVTPAPARIGPGLLVAPLVGADGRMLGRIELTGKRTGDFSASDQAIAVQLAQLASVAIENARLYRDLREAHRRKDEFLALLGHELRNPLAPIVTALQLMKLRGVTGGEAEREIIERQVRHMVQLVDDLLDVSRIMRGKIQLRLEPTEVATVLTRAVEMASPLFEERGHRLTVVVPRAGMRVLGDPVRLAQVFANLLTNAARYTEPGGVIGVSAHRQDDTVRIAVSDTGIGISPEMAPHIFEPFVQGDRSVESGSGGLGLGLALVRSLVELHRGEVTVLSEGRGRGSRFTVTLPAITTDEAAAGVEARAAWGGAVATPGERVLVVDDNPDAAAILAEALRALGHEVAVAHDGPEALSLAERFGPRAAVLDIGLPAMDGYELARRLRETHDGSLRLIALTGYGQEDDRERSRAAGFDAHLVKPVDLDTLATLIRHE